MFLLPSVSAAAHACAVMHRIPATEAARSTWFLRMEIGTFTTVCTRHAKACGRGVGSFFVYSRAL